VPYNLTKTHTAPSLALLQASAAAQPSSPASAEAATPTPASAASAAWPAGAGLLENAEPRVARECACQPVPRTDADGQLLHVAW
jgi:hypothetical protein